MQSKKISIQRISQSLSKSPNNKNYQIGNDKFEPIDEEEREFRLKQIYENRKKQKLNLVVQKFNKLRKNKKDYNQQESDKDINSEQLSQIQITQNDEQCINDFIDQSTIQDMEQKITDQEFLLKKNVSLVNEEDQNAVLLILKKPIKTQSQVKFLTKTIEGLPFFKNNENQLIRDQHQLFQLCRYLSLRIYKKNEVIFNQGDYGKEYFIVIKGKIMTLIKQNTDDQNLQDEQNEQINSKQSLDQINSIQTSQMEISNNNLSNQEKYILNKFKGYQNVWTYLPGQNFGELALIHNEKRTATMVCQEDSCVMVLTREGFDNIIKSVYYKTVYKRYQFFEQFDFFKGIQRSMLESFLHGLDSKLCKQNYIFYTDGQQLNNKIYFIKSGEIEISQIIDFQDLENKNDQSKKKFGKFDTDINFMNSNQPHLLNWGEQQKLKKEQNIRQRIVLKGPNCFFGEYEYLNEMEKRFMQAEVKTTAEVYELNAIDLINFLKIYEQGKDAFTLFKNESNLSIQWEKRHLDKLKSSKFVIQNQIDNQIQKINIDQDQQQNQQQIKFYLSRFNQGKNLNKMTNICGKSLVNSQNNNIYRSNFSSQNSLSPTKWLEQTYSGTQDSVIQTEKYNQQDELNSSNLASNFNLQKSSQVSPTYQSMNSSYHQQQYYQDDMHFNKKQQNQQNNIQFSYYSAIKNYVQDNFCDEKQFQNQKLMQKQLAIIKQQEEKYQDQQKKENYKNLKFTLHNVAYKHGLVQVQKSQEQQNKIIEQFPASYFTMDTKKNFSQPRKYVQKNNQKQQFTQFYSPNKVKNTKYQKYLNEKDKNILDNKSSYFFKQKSINSHEKKDEKYVQRQIQSQNLSPRSDDQIYQFFRIQDDQKQMQIQQSDQNETNGFFKEEEKTQNSSDSINNDEIQKQKAFHVNKRKVKTKQQSYSTNFQNETDYFTNNSIINQNRDKHTQNVSTFYSQLKRQFNQVKKQNSSENLQTIMPNQLSQSQKFPKVSNQDFIQEKLNQGNLEVKNLSKSQFLNQKNQNQNFMYKTNQMGFRQKPVSMDFNLTQRQVENSDTLAPYSNQIKFQQENNMDNNNKKVNNFQIQKILRNKFNHSTMLHNKSKQQSQLFSKSEKKFKKEIITKPYQKSIFQQNCN